MKPNQKRHKKEHNWKGDHTKQFWKETLNGPLKVLLWLKNHVPFSLDFESVIA